MKMKDRVESRMAELGINPTQLAKRLGHDGNGTVWSLLSGRTKSFRDMEGLAKALETSSEWLLTGKSADGNESSKKLLSELTKLTICSLIDKPADKTISEIKEKIVTYFWPDVEAGSPPTHEQIKRMAQTLIGDKK